MRLYDMSWQNKRINWETNTEQGVDEVEPISDNMQKYANYKEQMGRLKKALTQGFYLEAVFIEYAIMEDRLESALRHGGKWNPKPNEFWGMDKKLARVEKMAEEKKSVAARYFSVELLQTVRDWKGQRNRLIHALLKQSLHTPQLQEHVAVGLELVKTLNTKSAAFKRAVEKQKAV